MNRNRDQQNQGSNRQGNQDAGRNQDMPGGRSDQQSSKQQWDGNERRTGVERRNEPGDGSMKMNEMNEGSSR